MELSSTTENKTEFNHLQSKNKYLGLLELYYSSSTFYEKRNSLHLVKDTYRKDYLKKNPINKNNTRYEKFEVRDEGDDVVIVSIKKKEKPLEILSFETIYEILIQLHVDNNHKKMELKSATYLKYQIPDICFDLIPEACNVCKEEQSCASQTGIVTFIQQMALKSFAYHNALLIYIDKYTEFIIIRPMKSYDTEDMVTELFKIFMEFGTPKTVHMYLTKMSRGITAIMNRLCPSCNIVFDYKDDKQKTTFRVLDALGAWMRETESNCWEIGCSVVQRQLNTMVRATLPETQTPVTAHDLFFKNPSVFNKVNNLASRWFDIKLVKTASGLREQSNTEITFVCATQNEDLVPENQDPLATNVSNLNIQDEPESQIFSKLKINRQHSRNANYSKEIKETLKSKKTKTRKNKRISHKTLSDSEDEPLISIMTCGKEENVILSNEGFLTTVIINARNDIKTNKTRIKNNYGNENINEKTIETLDLTQNVNEGEETDSDQVKMTNTKASISEAGKQKDEEELYDVENIIIDFGAEESQVIDAEEVNIANTEASTSRAGKEKDEKDLHDDENIIFDFGPEEGHEIDITIANTEAFTRAEEETSKEDLPDDDSIIDFGAEI